MLKICKELEADRFDLIVAIYCLCNDWHGGQWSRGYKISCQFGIVYIIALYHTTIKGLLS